MPEITLKRPATCADCGAKLKKGDSARYYGRSRIYGLNCHERGDQAPRQRRSTDALRRRGPVDGSPGALASYYDPAGAYSADGTYLGKASGQRCEDAPCCGCCP